ncbi:S8 family peptidase [Plantactinospora solaniradicis]|uniref:S8 family peptidase n=1 Tax=Plantactinospora solaniradicis TaxID=1723736 RepID=A0ABW1KNS3_9ACTN
MDQDDADPGRPAGPLPAEFGSAKQNADGGDRAGPLSPVPTSPSLVTDSVIARPLQERMRESGDEPIGVVIELRTRHPGGVSRAQARVRELIVQIAGAGTPVWPIGSYVSSALTAAQIRALVAADATDATNADADAEAEAEQDDGAGTRPGRTVEEVSPPAVSGPAQRWSIHRIWPNFEVQPLIHRSVVTTKCQAAHRAFNAYGQDLVWAVLDSGIAAAHPHFHRHDNLGLAAPLAHRSFVGSSDDEAILDLAGHGTHVAGILAGEQIVDDSAPPLTAATWYQPDAGDTRCERVHLRKISGMAPRCKLLSCKVLRDDGSGDMAAVLAALEYIQELNDYGRELLVHGVNLSVGYPFDPTWFATGLSPICREVDRLVQSGVVVVVAAGNTGYGYVIDAGGRRMRTAFDLTINDPGNAELAITVGATSCRPHASGVSYFSSKGPTGDGRAKPDLVAPGERVISAGTGRLLERALAGVPEATYVENSGTSMAAPHVSGVAAAFMSVHQEFIGHPRRVKRALLESATSLGRDRSFQGYGLVDAMRALQSV